MRERADDDRANPAAPARQPGRRWGGRQAPLKLLLTLRGDGALVWSGGVTRASYALDLFAQGAARTAAGRLEGDFSALVAADPPATGVRLRLSDGREIDIDLVSVEPTVADVEANGLDERTLGAGDPMTPSGDAK
jgi:hypothetical protein